MDPEQQRQKDVARRKAQRQSALQMIIEFDGRAAGLDVANPPDAEPCQACQLFLGKAPAPPCVLDPQSGDYFELVKEWIPGRRDRLGERHCFFLLKENEARQSRPGYATLPCPAAHRK